MKAAAFDYIRVDSTEHALDLLAEHGGDAKLIAGGQSLVPMMAMRLARPALLVDINRVAALKTISAGPDHITLGAGVRQRDAEDSATLTSSLPLLGQALRWVGHLQTRNRGTVGGSLAYADPSAELPLACLVLGATLQLKSREHGSRSVAADDFFQGPMATALSDTECLMAIDWPLWPGPGVACAVEEVAIRQGDFAMASAACQLQVAGDGRIRRISFGLGGVDGRPMAFPGLAAQLLGQTLNAPRAREVARAAASGCAPGSDMHASAAYRTHLAGVLLERVLLQAHAQALRPGAASKE